MTHEIARRDFIKAAPAAASLIAAGLQLPEAPTPAETPYPEIGGQAYTPVADYPIRAKRFSEVAVADAFWKPKIAMNAEVTIPFEAHRDGERGDGLSGNVLEAAIYSLETHPDQALRAQVRERITTLNRDEGSRRSLNNEGFEVAVAWFNATGERSLLDPAIATADALYEDFKRRKPPFSGGERDATNCLALYHATHDKKHLDLAKHYLDIRGLPSSVNRSRHNQSYAPVLEQREAVGHAVNCATLMVSLADVGVLTGLRQYLDTAQRMWTDAAMRKMYITGGIGTTGNEGFGEPYVLPNISAYSETCAVLMFMTLNHRLFLATGDSKYIDVLERGMYNNALSGVSASGNRFFYVNRLASAGTGRDERWDRASLECCPPNLVRFLATMPGYIYAQDKQGAVYVNLYVTSKAGFKVAESEVLLAMDSDMPWGGRSVLTATTNQPTRASIKLRVPGWARNQPVAGSLYAYADGVNKPIRLAVNGKPVDASPDRLGYITLERVWKTGDSVALEFPMEVRKVVADTRVKQDRGRVAVERGPIVYCAEWPDCDDGRALDLLIDQHAPVTAASEPSLGRGVTVLTTAARRLTDPRAEAKPVSFVPYYLWANRGTGQMNVWLSTRELVPGDVGPSGGFVFYVNPNYATDGWRYLEAAPFDQSAGAPWGCFRHAIAGARGTAVGTGRKNTSDIVLACNDPQSAAALCANLVVNGVTGWFLPSRDELALMYTNLKATGVTDFGTRGSADNFSYWASTQATTDMAHHIDFADAGRQHYDDKDFPRRVRAIRTI